MTNKKQNTSKLFTFILLSAVIFFVNTSSTIIAKTKKPQSNSEILLWEISKGNKTAHILGSIHILREEDYPLSKKIDETFEQSQTLVFETNVDGFNNEIKQKTKELGFYPKDKKISDEIGANTYKDLQDTLKKIGVKEISCDRLKPWLCSLFIASIEYKKYGFRSGLGVEKYLRDKLKKLENDKSKKTLSLETVGFQIGLLANENKEFQEDALIIMLKDLSDSKEILTAMADAWKSADKEALNALLNESMDQFPEFHKLMITDRNKDWINKIDKIITEEEKVMIVVGAGHLVGKGNVLKLLEKKGYKVEQL